jgi:metallo-beta-lactamase family protein
MTLSIQFLGAAGTVTGSKFLLDDGKYKVLVDCGLFQGVKELRLRNWQRLPVAAKDIDAIVLTHAHLDHSGYLPLLGRHGYSRAIFASAPTRDLARLLLADSAHIQEEDAEYANKKGFSKHRPAEPLYTAEDAARVMRLFMPVPSAKWIEILPGWKLRLQSSGHILGSTFVEIETAGQRVVFSGDLGRTHPLTLPPPSRIARADTLIVESTYGDRIHPGALALDELERVINRTVLRGGLLLIPSFAVGRTQDVLYLLSELRRHHRIPGLPIYLDSPLGIHATEVLASHPSWHRLSESEVNRIYDITTIVKTRAESKALLHLKESAIILAGSGMVTGGRILHHLEKRLPDSRNTVLLSGFQAAGTRGRLLRDGATELKMHGRYVPVHAEIVSLDGLSAHADQSEIVAWLREFTQAPARTFIVHGEPQASDALRLKIRDTLGWDAHVPAALESFDLLPAGRASA